jgi:hypothetical protein
VVAAIAGPAVKRAPAIENAAIFLRVEFFIFPFQ